MIRMFTGIHTAPRQLELPPNMPVFDSAGRYLTVNVSPPTSTVKGCSRCQRESERTPCGLRKRSSSSMRVSTRRSLSSVSGESMRRLFTPGLPMGWMLAVSCGRLSTNAWMRCNDLWHLLQHVRLEDRHGGQRQQPDHRAHLDALRSAVRQHQQVVEEAVLLVPQLVLVVADAVHRPGDPQEVLHELERRTLRRCGRTLPARWRWRACSGCRTPSRQCRPPAPGSRRWAAAKSGRTRRCYPVPGSRR